MLYPAPEYGLAGVASGVPVLSLGTACHHIFTASTTLLF